MSRSEQMLEDTFRRTNAPLLIAAKNMPQTQVAIVRRSEGKGWGFQGITPPIAVKEMGAKVSASCQVRRL